MSNIITIPASWGERASSWASSRPIAASFMRLVRVVARDEQWGGACHMVGALLTVLLREQKISAELCIGLAQDSRPGALPFDHSWVEVDGEVYDIAILRPLDESWALSPVFAGKHLETGERPGLTYGVASELPPDPAAFMLLNLGFAGYMDEAPIPLWDIASEHAVGLGLTGVTGRALRRRHQSITWSRRAPYDS